jgi:malonate-semialdehyde dehydrogenase (acetylating)/methylmalonate-semialdehyde dehydrogenase
MKITRVFKTQTLFKGPTFKQFSVKKLQNFINGEFVDSKATKYYEIRNPATNELISEVPETPKNEFDQAVAAAKIAYKSWRNVPLPARQRYMFDYLRLLKERQVNDI